MLNERLFLSFRHAMYSPRGGFLLRPLIIAPRAIAPPVNDPSTAINCVYQLSRILIHFASREEAASLRYDPPGILRVSIPWPNLDRLVDTAVDQIRLYSPTDVAVSRRMLRALGALATTIPDSAAQQRLAERGGRIVAGCAEKLNEGELSEMRLRFAALERVVSGPQS